MARHLVAAGHDVVGCDLDRGRVEALGADRAAMPGEAAAGADVVLLSLPSADAVADVVLGERGVRSAARPGTLLVDMSTSPPSLARRLAARVPGAGRPRRAGQRWPPRRRGRVADDHGRRHGGRVRARTTALRGARPAGRARRRPRGRPGGEALQQPDRGRDDGRNRGVLRDRASARGSIRPRSTSSSPRRPATRVSCARASRFPAWRARIPRRTGSRPSSPST